MKPDLELMIGSMPPLTNRIAEWRTRRGLNQRQLAELVGLEHTTIGRLERDELPLKTEHLLLLGRALECHPLELIVDLKALAFTEDERAAVEAIRSMDEEGRSALLTLMRRSAPRTS